MRILIADDHELVRSGIVCILERLGYDVIGQARDGNEAVALWRELRPDITLLDLRMPGLDGVGAVGAICEMDADARTVLMTTHDGDEPVSRALRAGAKSYLLKGVSPEVLKHCLETVHAGGRYLDADLAQRIAAREGAPSPTARELEVLAGVVQGLCNKRIGRALGIEEGTVKAHLKNLLPKIEAVSRTHAALIAIRRGIVYV